MKPQIDFESIIPESAVVQNGFLGMLDSKNPVEDRCFYDVVKATLDTINDKEISKTLLEAPRLEIRTNSMIQWEKHGLSQGSHDPETVEISSPQGESIPSVNIDECRSEFLDNPGFELIESSEKIALENSNPGQTDTPIDLPNNQTVIDQIDTKTGMVSADQGDFERVFPDPASWLILDRKLTSDGLLSTIDDTFQRSASFARESMKTMTGELLPSIKADRHSFEVSNPPVVKLGRSRENILPQSRQSVNNNVRIDANIVQSTIEHRQLDSGKSMLDYSGLEKLIADSSSDRLPDRTVTTAGLFSEVVSQIERDHETPVISENYRTSEHLKIIKPIEKTEFNPKNSEEINHQINQNADNNRASLFQNRTRQQSIHSENSQSVSSLFSAANRGIHQYSAEPETVKSNQFPLVKQISSVIVQSVKTGQNVVHFRINTEHYGDIDIRFINNKDESSGTIIVESAATQALIEKLIPIVNENLVAKEIYFSSLNVEVGHSDQERSDLFQRRTGKNRPAFGINIKQENNQARIIHDFGYNSIEIVA